MGKKAPVNRGSLGIFKQQKYKEVTLSNGVSAGHLSPASTDGLANNAEAVLSFFHVPSESDVFFKAFITTFAENYNCDWNPDTVFGRTDPIYTFKNTTRSITLGWKIPAETISEAYENLGKLQKLSQFLYPNYADLGNSSTVMTQSPLVRVKLMNLLAQSKGPVEAVTSQELNARAIFQNYISTNNPSEGLLCVINGMNVIHNLENPDVGVVQTATNTILPKLIDVSVDLAVIHEETLGWDTDNTFKDPNFPYNAILESESDSVMSAGSYDEKIAARQASERARVKAEQDRANAQARGYNGMFGEAFKKADAKKLRKLSEKAYAGEELSERQQDKFQYLASAQQGYVAEGKTVEERGERAKELLDYLE
jgi:hypothetical protein